jgi:hypothetical protein
MTSNKSLLHNVNERAIFNHRSGEPLSHADRTGNGGASRDRTDDLKLAKLPLSQLSYGPKQVCRSVQHWLAAG